MGIFDWILLLFLIFLLWRGWRKGFIGMLLHLAGVILVFFLIAHYYPAVKQGLIDKLHLGGLLATILAVVLIVALIALIVQIIRLLLEKAMKMMKISFLNSALGALLGFLTGLLFIIVVSLFIDFVPSWRKPLENPQKHRVYSAVKVVRGELYSALKMKQKAVPAPADTTKTVPAKKK
jgi:membrane protein required for colicin V production